MRREARHRNAGFTLIELLVAISLMALMAVMGWQGLDSIAGTRASLDRALAHTRGLQATFAQLQVDAWQNLPPSQLNEQPTLWASGSSITLLRRMASPERPGRVQRVTYRLDGDELVRETESLAPGEPAGTDGRAPRHAALQTVRLLPDVRSITVRVWVDDRLGWQAPLSGRATQAGATPPRGVELGVTLRGQSRPVTQKFVLGAA